jgi:hypothetical protein
MSEMVDRVAKAIIQSFKDEGVAEGIGPGASWEEAQRAAAAAIAAMREPTDDMKNEVYDTRGIGDRGGVERESFLTEWETAIDAALREDRNVTA